MNQLLASKYIDISSVSNILKLEGKDLLEAIALTLHQSFSSLSTCIIEQKRFQRAINTITYAANGTVSQTSTEKSHNAFCNASNNGGCSNCQHYKELTESNSQDAFFRLRDSEVHVSTPIKSTTGEVMGFILSRFDQNTKSLNEELLMNYHQIFADLILHTFREQWLSNRTEQLVNQLSYEASHDSLTGLLNRSCLTDSLEFIIQQASGPFTLAFIDINGFKAINDIHGHYVGDKVIKFVADTILSSITDLDQVFRIAGDEFAFITYSPDPIAVCHAILEKIEPGYKDLSNRVNFNVSIGIARAQENGKDVEQLFLNTSLALKECKKTSDIDVQCYDTHLSAQYHRKTQLIDAIRRELNSPITDEQELYVVVQPIVTKNKANWDYFEVLTRWHSSIYGMVSPVEFIQAAEESGLIVKLGERIIELACIAKQKLELGLGYKVKFGINCSALELADSQRYLSHLIKVITQHDFHPHEFVIELTETVLLSKPDEIHNVLISLRSLGFTVALDDFGTGYSSLNYIHSYPIDCIKIDATFIRNILNNKTSESVVGLIIKLAQQLNVNLVAEGIEHKAELEKLHSMGCYQIQGYYFSRPDKPELILEQLNQKLNNSRRA